MKSEFILAVLALAVSSVANQAFAADAAPTVITVGKMHCAGCAKKIAVKLYEVRGVAEVGQSNRHALRSPISRRAVENSGTGRSTVPTISVAGEVPVRQDVPVTADQAGAAFVTIGASSLFIVNITGVDVA